MKRTLLAIVPLACISVSAAAQNEQQDFNGLFAGVKGGVLNSFANVDSTTNANYNTAIFTSFFNQSTQTNRHAIVSNIFATGAINIGYGKKLSNNQFYLGGEVSGNAASRDLSITSSGRNATTISTILIGSNLKTKTKVQFNTIEIDVDFKPGVVIDPATLIYGRIGAAFNRIQITSNNSASNTFSAFRTAFNTNNFLNLSSQKNVVGLRVGLGAERFITNKISATTDYVFTWYGNGPNLNGTGPIKNPIPFINLPTVNGFRNHTSSNMYAQTFMLGINYYFNRNS